MKQLLSLLSLMLFVAVGTTSCTQGDKPSSNEIWYTTRDGNIVEPKLGALGAHIISNTYNNGKGVIIVEADSIVEIGIEAFSGCSSLTSITIPDSVTSIRYRAFYNCYSLTSITIPDSVTSIGDGAFSDCPNLSSFAGKFATADGRCLIANGKLIAFAPSGLTRYSIPDSVTSIEWGAFYGCTSLTNVTIPDSVTSIVKCAFSFCSSLTSITIPDSVTSIGGHAFDYCTSLTSITIPDGVTEIGDYAFYNCPSLIRVTIGNGVTSIGDYAFCGCTSLKVVYCKPVTPPSGGPGMFNDNTSGRKIYVPRGGVNSYKKAEYWNNYAYNFLGYDF